MVRGESKTEVELKNEHHRKDHEKYLKSKNERLERHSGSGKDGAPKKGGCGGKGTWGSVDDDIREYTH
eukprot:jgi/Tetstr1/431298/TSEL_020992.t1